MLNIGTIVKVTKRFSAYNGHEGRVIYHIGQLNMVLIRGGEGEGDVVSYDDKQLEIVTEAVPA